VTRPVAATFLVVFDIDSTLINEEGLDLVAKRAGKDIFQAVQTITDEAMAGRRDFADSLRSRVALLEGAPVALVEDVATAITPTRGAATFIDWVHEHGGVVGAVSGGFHEVVDGLTARLGVDHVLANRFGVRGSDLTGVVDGDIVDAAAKARFLEHWASHYGVEPARTVAIGDGANDLAMFDIAGLSVSFCGKPIANAHAHVTISHRDLMEVIPHLDHLVSVTHS